MFETMREKSKNTQLWQSLSGSKAAGWLRSIWKKLPDEARNSLRFLAVLFPLILCFSIIVHLGSLQALVQGVSVEMYGLLMDLFLFGAVILYLDKLREAGRERERLLDLIDDFRAWKEKEAGYRIWGAVKKLRKIHNLPLGSIPLKECFLGITCKNESLDDAEMPEIDLTRGDFSGSTFNGANMDGAHMNEGTFIESKFIGTQMRDAVLKGGVFTEANFTEAHLNHAHLNAKSFYNTIFDGADLSNVVNHDYQTLKQAASFKNATLPKNDPVFKRLKQDFPDKF